MKVIGICTDKEELDLLKENYKEKFLKLNMKILDGKDFDLFLKEAYSNKISRYEDAP